MKKSSFLTFCLALVPGIGQMYLGYMLRGLSLMSLFCAAIAFTSVVYIIGFTLPVIWAFAFFDTFRLRNQPDDQPKLPDGLLFGLSLNDSSVLQRFLDQRHNLIGWALILLGGWLILDRFILRSLQELCSQIGFWLGYEILDRIPTLIVALLLVVLGVLLMRPRKSTHPAQDSFKEFNPIEPSVSEAEDSSAPGEASDDE